MKFHVMSGNLNCEVEAKGFQSAAIVALQTQQWSSLGLLMRISKVGETDQGSDCFWDTETALAGAGIHPVG